MDLRTTTGPPTPAERSAIEEALAGTDGVEELSGGRLRPLPVGLPLRPVAAGGIASAERRRQLLLPVLHALQERIGWVSHPALDFVCAMLDIAPAEAYATASAYAMLDLSPAPPLRLHVCDDVACRAGAGVDPAAGIEAALGPQGGEGPLRWERSPCLGHCEHGSAALVQQAGAQAGRATLAPFTPAVLTGASPPLDLGRLPLPAPRVPQADRDPASLRLLRRVGAVDPSSLDSYRAHGGYRALRRALDDGPAAVLDELRRANLLGRGGAAYPTAAKWEAVSRNPVRPHYFVVNADESEPGTFKDRVVVEADPFAVVEAATVAGITTGAEQGYVYLRGEYPLAERRLAGAIRSCTDRGLLGDDVMGSGRRFLLEVRRGAGAYIAGEETALFNSIEGRRPEPRNKPPYPTERGLFAKPTGVNNVETLLCVLEILQAGADAFAAVGTAASTGTRLFCVSGAVVQPGLYEIPLGTPLRELIDLAGGSRPGRRCTAVLLGGAAGTFVRPDQLDVELSFEGARQAGATLGSGVVIVVDDRTDLRDLLRRIARFFRDESCGQCVPCRVGTVRQEEVLARLSAGRPFGSVEDELSLLEDLGAVLRDASICGLGQTAASAIHSAIGHRLITFSEERP